MRFATTLLCTALAVATIASDTNPQKEPISVDKTWEQAHGGPAPTYQASVNWPQESIAQAVGHDTESFEKDAATSNPIVVDTDDTDDIPVIPRRVDFTEDPAWAKEHGYAALNKRDLDGDNDIDIDTDVDSEAWAEEEGYVPLAKRDVEIDVESEQWAKEEGYAALEVDGTEGPEHDVDTPPTKRSTDFNIGSEEWAKEHGYLTLNRRDASPNGEYIDEHDWPAADKYASLDKRSPEDPEPDDVAVGFMPPGNRQENEDDSESEVFAIANGYTPLGKRHLNVVAPQAVSGPGGRGFFNWFLGRGRRPAVHRRDVEDEEVEEDAESDDWATQNGDSPLIKRDTEAVDEDYGDELDAAWAAEQGYTPLDRREVGGDQQPEVSAGEQFLFRLSS